MKKVLVPLSIFLRSDPILYLKPVNRIFHYITAHKGVKLFACEICDETFNHSCQLKGQVATHME